jgi:hypothetical protein
MDITSLLTADAVRRAARRMLGDAEAGRLDHFELDLGRLPDVADRVAAVTRASYPDLKVPFHARWRHFEVGGRDRWGQAVASAGWPDALSKARAAFDLVIVSVLLDAGSGGLWSYREPESGDVYRASEGLGVASFELIRSGALSARPGDPWRADASQLQAFSSPALASAFQVGPDNPLGGLDGRVALLRALGAVCIARPDLFASADDPRPGGLADAVRARAVDGAIAAPALLALVLEALGPIWPGRLTVEGVSLGDAWIYPRWQAGGEVAEAIAPFHKLSQWLTYSLIEPALAMGFNVTDIDGLTGLAEYRNGGLFLDMGVIRLKDPNAAATAHAVGDPLIVEWRALTVALLDRLHPMVAERLGVPVERFPLACLLEGGTWSAGRQVAREKRGDGGPPLRIVSDGTTF